MTYLRSTTVLPSAIFVVATALAASAACAAVGNLQMFLDDTNIAQATNLGRVVQQPTKHPNPVITSNGSWQSNPYMIGNAIYDEQDKIYKAWYQSYNSGQPLAVRTPFLYATSTDGRNWTLPNLGLVNYNGSTNNNILFQNGGFHDSYSPMVLKDMNESDPSRRYKMIYWDYSGPVTYRDAGMYVAFSPDGIHWTQHPGNPQLYAEQKEQSISDVMDVMQDPATGKFVAYTKGWADPHPAYRLIVRTESTDFVNWSTPEVVIRHVHNAADPQSYGMPVFAYEGIYIGLLRSYKNPGNETINTQLAVSHDNKSWSRVANQQTFMPVGPPGSFDDGMVFTTPPVVRGDTLEFFYGGWDGPHNTSSRRAVIGLATLPAGRFVALTASDGVQATLTTTAFKLNGSEIELNANGNGGPIRVAILDAQGQVIGGHAFADADAVATDDLHHLLTWNGESDLSAYVGQQISLRFEIRGGAKLYGFRVVNINVPEPGALGLIGAAAAALILSRPARKGIAR